MAGAGPDICRRGRRLYYRWPAQGVQGYARSGLDRSNAATDGRSGAAGSAALYSAWKQRIDPLDISPIEAHTIADSISAGLPRDRVKATRAVVETDGAFVSVSDEEILDAIPVLGRDAGVFAEPAGAAPYAGLKKAVSSGLVSPHERVVLLVTGNGLKDVASAIKSTGSPTVIEPTSEAVDKALDTLT